MKQLLILLCMIVFVVACGKGKENEAAKDHLFSTQQKAMEEAKKVEDVLEKAQQERRKQIEESMRN